MSCTLTFLFKIELMYDQLPRVGLAVQSHLHSAPTTVESWGMWQRHSLPEYPAKHQHNVVE